MQWFVKQNIWKTKFNHLALTLKKNDDSIFIHGNGKAYPNFSFIVHTPTPYLGVILDKVNRLKQTETYVLYHTLIIKRTFIYKNTKLRGPQSYFRFTILNTQHYVFPSTLSFDFCGLTLRLWSEAPESIYSISRSCVNVVLGAVLAGLTGLFTAPP